MTFGYQKGTRRLRTKVTERRRSFWDRLFGTNNRSGRQDKVLEYVIHRVQDGTNLREMLQEEYVRRNATTEEVQRILENPGSSRPLASSCARTSPLGSSTLTKEETLGKASPRSLIGLRVFREDRSSLGWPLPT
jgi:hypothetical protein